MPRGIPSTKKSGIEKTSTLMVSPGAKYYPGTQSEQHPEGLPIPDGIRVRSEKSVEVRFYIGGQRTSETVRGKPTVAFVSEIARKRDRVQQLISLGKFSDAEYEEEFPESPRFRKPHEVEKPMTVGKALDEWMMARDKSVGQNTNRDYTLLIRNQLKPLKLPKGLVSPSAYVKLGKDEVVAEGLTLDRQQGGPARKINPKDHEVLGQLPVEMVDDVLINTIRKYFLDTEKLSIKRVSNLITPLRGAITRLVLSKKLAINPFDLVEPLKKEAPPLMAGTADGDMLDAPLPSDDIGTFIRTEGAPEPFNTDEMTLVISQLDAPMANQFTFAFWTGLRTGETIALRVNDLQLDKNRILVRRSLSRGVLKTTKTDKQRWVNLLPPAKAAIERQLELFKAPGGWVFPNPFTRRRWANDAKITRRWTKALRRAGVRYRRPYQTRHTYASMMLSAGENIMYVAQQMGHADWSMLVKVYADWIPSSSAQPAGSLVSNVHQKSWANLLGILEARPSELNIDDDAESDDEDDCSQIGESSEEFQC